MELFASFKKHYLHYLISIILPAIITGVSVPLLKRILGAEHYGYYALFFNAALITTAVLSGWIVQGILRFHTLNEDKLEFYKKIFSVFWLLQLVVFIPAFILAAYTGKNIVTGILFAFIIVVTSLQNIGLAIIQSSKKSVKNIYSEAIRSVFYILGWSILLTFTAVYYLHSLFIAVIISFSFSCLYIFRYSEAHLNLFVNPFPIRRSKFIEPQFFYYSIPFSLWFVFSSLLSYIDKLFILKSFNGEIQGNYQAMFDLISKSIIILLSPALTSVFPLLTEAYKKGLTADIQNTVNKILKLEIYGLILTSLAYWFGGDIILFKLLKIPDNNTYKLMGLIVIVGTFVWQLGMLVHKKFELKQMSFFLLKTVIISFLSQLFIYILFAKVATPLLYPLGYMVSAMVYLILISVKKQTY